jgi:hypothetical protein
MKRAFNPHDPIDIQNRDRMHGKIPRRVRKIGTLSTPQIDLAQQLQDRYQISEEHSQTHLDYYYALLKNWISEEQFEAETGLIRPSEQL